VKKIISNWHFFHYFWHLHPQPKSRKRITYYFFAILLAAGGSWLMLFLLGLKGIFPFGPLRPTAIKESFVEAFSPSVSYWSEEIQAWADAWNLDPLLIATVMQIESCGDPKAVSPAGAQGLFQVMPYHFEPGENPLDPETNAMRGLAYLQQSHELSEGDIERTLAGYNGGHGQISKEKFFWPEETLRYTHWGGAIYAEAASGGAEAKALSAWLEAGGGLLCQAAEAHLNLDE
jgi:hypothetical protein